MRPVVYAALAFSRPYVHRYFRRIWMVAVAPKWTIGVSSESEVEAQCFVQRSHPRSVELTCFGTDSFHSDRSNLLGLRF